MLSTRRKPADQLSEAYRRRLERGLAKGKTLQGARGHRRNEHIARRSPFGGYGFSSTDRAFLARQKLSFVDDEEGSRYEAAKEYYRLLSPPERAVLRKKQQAMRTRWQKFNRNRHAWRDRYGKPVYRDDAFWDEVLTVYDTQAVLFFYHF